MGRIVALAIPMNMGFDYDETFAPVAKVLLLGHAFVSNGRQDSRTLFCMEIFKKYTCNFLSALKMNKK